MQLSKILSFFRWHTASLTIPAFLIGVYSAGIPILSFDTILWIIAGWLFHATGFAHNNLTDYEWDLKDTSKSHHPLVSGELKYGTAYGIVCAMFFISTVWIMFLTKLHFLPVILLVISVLSGMGYNYLSKKSLIAPILISICFGILPGISYFSYTEQLSPLILIVIGYAFFQILFQISVEGYIKDIQHDPVNLYRKFGCKIERDRYYGTSISKIFAMTIKLPMLLFGLLICIMCSTPLWGIIMFLVMVILALYSSWYLVRDKKWERGRVVRFCAITEIITYFGLVFCLAGIFGIYGVLFLLVFPLAWFIFWNKIFWNTWIAPAV